VGFGRAARTRLFSLFDAHNGSLRAPPRQSLRRFSFIRIKKKHDRDSNSGRPDVRQTDCSSIINFAWGCLAKLNSALESPSMTKTEKTNNSLRGGWLVGWLID
jgi:hypothetical protein